MWAGHSVMNTGWSNAWESSVSSGAPRSISSVISEPISLSNFTTSAWVTRGNGPLMASSFSSRDPTFVARKRRLRRTDADYILYRDALGMKDGQLSSPRETPLSAVTLRQLASLAGDGVTVMPVSPGWDDRPSTIDDIVDDFVNRVLQILGVEIPGGWRAGELEGIPRALPSERVPEPGN